MLDYQKNYNFPKEVSFPKIKLNHEKCIHCGLCVQKCSVKRVYMIETLPVFDKNIECIYCGECFFNCPNDAIDFNIESFKEFLEKVSQMKKTLSDEGNAAFVYFKN